jgi:hypothetical protein
MNGLNDWDIANLFLNVITWILFFGTLWGFIRRGLSFIMPKGRTQY